MMQDDTMVDLTKEDVARLLADPSPDARSAASAKIAKTYDTAVLNEEERRIAEEIFRILSKDVELRVRQALSTNLKANTGLPRDVAVTLAKDVESVALPVLKISEVLTDEDLIDIVRAQNSAKLVAVAQRPSVSEQVSDALVDSGNNDAVARLVRNGGAQISEAAYGRVVENYAGSSAVTDSLNRRPDLPPAISERVVAAMTERLHEYLISKQEVSADMASDLILQTRERAIMGLLDYGSSDAELENLVVQLHRKNGLTPSLLLRVVCAGDLALFERALAVKTGLPLKNVQLLIHDKSLLGFESLYLRADLPKGLYPAFRAAVVLATETDYDGGTNDRERYLEKMLERMLTHFPDPAKRISSSDIEFLISKLRQIAA